MIMKVPEDPDDFADYWVKIFKANPEETKKQIIKRYSPILTKAGAYRASKAEIEREKDGWKDLQ